MMTGVILLKGLYFDTPKEGVCEAPRDIYVCR